MNKRIGRPASGLKTTVMSVSVNNDVLNTLNNYLAATGNSRSDVVSALLVEAMMKGKFDVKKEEK